jgi:hypothetical protein
MGIGVRRKKQKLILLTLGQIQSIEMPQNLTF